MSSSFVTAEIHLRLDSEVSRLGSFRFGALPRVGERVMLGEGANELWVKIEQVTHVPVQSDSDEWDGIIILNCEIFD